MRMRRKPHLAERMERCDRVWVRDPSQWRGRWREKMPQARQLHLEIGCGKGKFTVAMASQNPETLFVALEKNPDAMMMAMEAAMEAQVNNLFFAEADAADLLDLLAPGEADLIYLNFCDPWPSNRHRHRRLTYRTFLQKYRSVLAPGGRLLFRTDNVALFQFTRIELREDGWKQEHVTTDRHHDGPVGIMTGYEEKFFAEGKPICSLEAIPPTMLPEQTAPEEGEDGG